MDWNTRGSFQISSNIDPWIMTKNIQRQRIIPPWLYDGPNSMTCMSRLIWGLSSLLVVGVSTPSLAQYSNPMAPGYYQRSNPMSPGYVQDRNPMSPGYIQRSNPMSPGYVQDRNPMSPGYVQDRNPMSPGYVQDKKVFGF